MLGLIAQLYDIEDTIREQSAAERLAARQERSVPVLERLGAYLREQKDGALPKSQYGRTGDRLRPEPLGRAPTVHRGRPSGD